MALKRCIHLVAFCTICNFASTRVLDPDPSVEPTKGAVWPKPQQQDNSSDFLIFSPKTFQFQVTNEDCKLLQDALSRYLKIISMDIGSDAVSISDVAHSNVLIKEREEDGAEYLTKLDVRLSSPCQGLTVPEVDMKEEYVLSIKNKDGQNYLTAPSIWGIIRGLETFSQLIYKDQEKFKISSTYIHDYPRFPHRGLLVDTARHFISVKKILLILDGMAYNKLNVFHWHITDDKSFPYVSKTFPELSQNGAYTQSMTYSPADVLKIVKYAADRGIRVIPEFDSPGHTRSWGKGIPGLLTQCYKNGTILDTYGPINPTSSSTYTFMKKFLREILSVFPDSYIHLGADEVGLDCWESNPQIKEFMHKHNFTNHTDLEQYYLDRVFQIVDDLNGTPIVWEDVFSANIKFKRSTVVEVWRDPWSDLVANITQAGYKVLLSAGFYLDYIDWGGDWLKFYLNDPTNFIGTDEQEKLVIGGEACMWSESVNEYSIEQRIWPRASAVAERLWSPMELDDYLTAASRIEEHACRMNKRGIAAQPPNGAGFCVV